MEDIKKKEERIWNVETLDSDKEYFLTLLVGCKWNDFLFDEHSVSRTEIGAFLACPSEITYTIQLERSY